MVRGRRPAESLPPERWREVVTCVRPKRGRYIVSNHGKLRHVFDSGKYRELRATHKTEMNGSRKMILKYRHDPVNNRYKEIPLHRIVWEAFKGPVPDGMYIVHINKDYTDNALWNLKAVTKSQLGTMFGTLSSMKNRYITSRNDQKSIVHVDIYGNVLAQYRSSRKAAEGYGMLSYQAILDRCNHRVKRDVYLPDGTTFMWEDELYE